MDALKTMEKHCPRKCFWTKEKETRTKIYLRVSANRLSNNWSQVVKQNLMFLELFLGLERERKIHPPWNVVRVSKLHILVVQITTKKFSKVWYTRRVVSLSIVSMTCIFCGLRCVRDTRTLGWLLRRREFPPGLSRGSVFVYLILPQNVLPARFTPAWVFSVVPVA